MRFFFMMLIFSCVDAGQGFNSNSFDEEIFSPADIDDSTAAGARFAAAYNILTSKCANCHTHSIHNIWPSYQTDQAWINAGLVIQSDSQNSQIIRRLINNGSDMPQGGSALSNEDLTALEDWIDQI